MPEPSRIARLRITLDDTEPTVWRTVAVPLTASLKLLHEVIQAAMPFQDYHLFQFQEGAVLYAIPHPEWPDGNTLSAKTTKLGALVDRGTTAFAYNYDFGDNWQHTITVEELGPADPAVAYPRFLDGARRAPPEDVGGTIGFEEFLAGCCRSLVLRSVWIVIGVCHGLADVREAGFCLFDGSPGYGPRLRPARVAPHAPAPARSLGKRTRL
ncbi:plasmid pRiA4b ORF-3 family protein [Methylobacterium sp. WL103]|uniref:plasmid pRiA4b ORF-3 family protein n=1 Tax=Methylobacterium sp. WL103 TaxID=2603891 RepID=UPI0011C6FF0A|nr:plasmid pRiA4b ORF-3 family protein [Methylobacterium sp. WL103]TXN07678.1 plasmid pRiA4b ORF-3 family protein [Methylobacterium sp. WL103]